MNQKTRNLNLESLSRSVEFLVSCTERDMIPSSKRYIGCSNEGKRETDIIQGNRTACPSSATCVINSTYKDPSNIAECAPVATVHPPCCEYPCRDRLCPGCDTQPHPTAYLATTPSAPCSRSHLRKWIRLNLHLSLRSPVNVWVSQLLFRSSYS